MILAVMAAPVHRHSKSLSAEGGVFAALDKVSACPA